MTDQTQTKAPARKPVHLPALPEGWAYQIYAQSPDGQGGTVHTRDGSIEVEWDTGTGVHRQPAEDLAAGIKALAVGVKALDAVRKGEETLQQSREKAMAALGEADRPPGVEATPSTAPADND